MLPDSSKWVEKSGKGVEQVRGHIALYDQCTMGCEIKYSTIFIQWWAHLRGLQSLMANMVILGQNNHFQGTPRDIFMEAKNSQMTVPDMKYNVEPSLTNVEPIWGRWNHLWPIWQFRAKIGRFFGPPGPKSGPNHEKMRALCSTIITWSRKITKTVPAFKNCHGLKITRLGLPSTLCYACTSSRPIPLLTAVPMHLSTTYLCHHYTKS